MGDPRAAVRREAPIRSVIAAPVGAVRERVQERRGLAVDRVNDSFDHARLDASVALPPLSVPVSMRIGVQGYCQIGHGLLQPRVLGLQFLQAPRSTKARVPQSA